MTLGVTGWVFREPTPASSPHLGARCQVLPFQLLSLEKGLTPTAPLTAGEVEKEPRVHLTSAKMGSCFPLDPQQCRLAASQPSVKRLK